MLISISILKIFSKIMVTVFIQNQNILGFTESKENKWRAIWKRNVVILMENFWTSKMANLYQWMWWYTSFFKKMKQCDCLLKKCWVAKGIPGKNLQQGNCLCLMTSSFLSEVLLWKHHGCYLSMHRSNVSGQFQLQLFSFKVSKVNAYTIF